LPEKEQSFKVLIMTPERVVYEGDAESLVLPGEKGVFEVLPYHKRLLSRLLRGRVILNNQHSFPIKRGVVKVSLNETVLIVEEEESKI